MRREGWRKIPALHFRVSRIAILVQTCANSRLGSPPLRGIEPEQLRGIDFRSLLAPRYRDQLLAVAEEKGEEGGVGAQRARNYNRGITVARRDRLAGLGL